MIKIVDTYLQIDALFVNEIFQFKRWETYINSIYDNCADVFVSDLKECLDNGNYTYEKDVLPIINAVHNHSALAALHTSFCNVTNGLNSKVAEAFGHEIDIDIVLYVGLCNAAGWVTNINGRDTILLGIEKILELNWQDEDSMRGLIYHELGHAYHKQYGIFHQSSDSNDRNFVWQLFTEGIAMYFEQLLVRNINYYHQDRNGWLEWCNKHFCQIAEDFFYDLPTMTRANQKYFGDWVNYNGRGDVGYYLGTKFVHRLCDKYDFEQLINMKLDDVYGEYLLFTEWVK